MRNLEGWGKVGNDVASHDVDGVVYVGVAECVSLFF